MNHLAADNPVILFESLLVEQETALMSGWFVIDTVTAKMGVMNTSALSVLRTSFSVGTKHASVVNNFVMVAQTVVTRVTRVKGLAVVLVPLPFAAVVDVVLNPTKSVMGTWTVMMAQMRGLAVS